MNRVKMSIGVLFSRGSFATGALVLSARYYPEPVSRSAFQTIAADRPPWIPMYIWAWIRTDRVHPRSSFRDGYRNPQCLSR